jgi:hypothetical protein
VRGKSNIPRLSSVGALTRSSPVHEAAAKVGPRLGWTALWHGDSLKEWSPDWEAPDMGRGVRMRGGGEFCAKFYVSMALQPFVEPWPLFSR